MGMGGAQRELEPGRDIGIGPGRAIGRGAGQRAVEIAGGVGGARPDLAFVEMGMAIDRAGPDLAAIEARPGRRRAGRRDGRDPAVIHLEVDPQQPLRIGRDGGGAGDHRRGRPRIAQPVARSGG